jgi:hypothetical protein
MRFAGNAARVEETKKLFGILVGQSDGKNYLGDLGADKSILFRSVLNN